MSRPNTRQRSWDNYVGDNPIKRNKYTDFYGQSGRWGPKDLTGLGSAMEQLSNEEMDKKERRRMRGSQGEKISAYNRMRIRNAPRLTGIGGMSA